MYQTPETFSRTSLLVLSQSIIHHHKTSRLYPVPSKLTTSPPPPLPFVSHWRGLTSDIHCALRAGGQNLLDWAPISCTHSGNILYQESRHRRKIQLGVSREKPDVFRYRNKKGYIGETTKRHPYHYPNHPPRPPHLRLALRSRGPQLPSLHTTTLRRSLLQTRRPEHTPARLHSIERRAPPLLAPMICERRFSSPFTWAYCTISSITPDGSGRHSCLTSLVEIRCQEAEVGLVESFFSITKRCGRIVEGCVGM